MAKRRSAKRPDDLHVGKGKSGQIRGRDDAAIQYVPAVVAQSARPTAPASPKPTPTPTPTPKK